MNKCLVRFCVPALLCAAIVLAQSTTQQISGSVKDASGGVVTTAKVTVRHVSTGQVRNTTVNESGYYAVSSIPIGDFEITVEAAGFKTSTQKNVKVDVNAKTNVDVTLE